MSLCYFTKSFQELIAPPSVSRSEVMLALRCLTRSQARLSNSSQVQCTEANLFPLAFSPVIDGILYRSVCYVGTLYWAKLCLVSVFAEWRR